MKIWYSKYFLNPKTQWNRKSARKKAGFLIKVQSKDFRAGYADCCPVLEFGDQTVDQQIQNLKSGRLNELLVRTLYYAVLDGEARAQKLSLFLPSVEVRSHYTCVNYQELTNAFLTELSEKGFESIKVKVGAKPVHEALFFSRLPLDILKLFKWRLDFNGQGGREFLSRASDAFLEQVEFVEDPEAFHLKKWRQLSQKFSVKLAFDQPPGSATASEYKDMRVIKPARMSLLARRKDVITNSMDHPVGQSFAFWESQRRVVVGGQARDFGLKTNHLIKENEFAREIQDESPFFMASEGYGIGFDKLLKGLPWKAL